MAHDQLPGSAAPTAAEVLALPMRPNDAGAETVGDYLVQLLRELWREQEGFSGKRPFGNSGWSWDLYDPLVLAGHVEGVIDEDGYIEDISREAQTAADVLIDLAIQALWPRGSAR